MKCDQCGKKTSGLPNDWMVFTKESKIYKRPFFRFQVNFVLCPGCFEIYNKVAEEIVKDEIGDVTEEIVEDEVGDEDGLQKM